MTSVVLCLAWSTAPAASLPGKERTETLDWISRNRFASTYSYHHGYFDGFEREFRGFGRVDQIDTEDLGALTAFGSFPPATNISAESYVPPVLTKTWFHNGAYPMGGRVTPWPGGMRRSENSTHWKSTSYVMSHA